MARLAKLDLPTSLPTDEPRVSICINRDWLSIIMNACTRLEWGASWRDGTNIDQAEQRVFDLYSLFRSAGDCGDMGCCDDLQTQIDDLLTQQQGNAAQNYQQAQAQAKLMHDRYQDIWDANPTPTAINPNAPTTNWNGVNSSEDNQALCSATAAFVRNWATLKTQQFDIVFGSLLVALGIGFAFIPGLGWAFLAAVAITLSAAALPVGLTYNTVRQALTDEAALDAVACCMNSYLKNKAINQANFQNSLSSCGFAGGSYAAIVRDVLANDLAGNWLLFIDLVGQAKTELLAGRSVYCPCAVPTWVYEWDLLTSNGGWVVNGAGQGAWTFGQGWVMQCFNAGGSNWYMLAQIKKTVPVPSRIDSIQMDVTATLGNDLGGRFVSAYFDGASTPATLPTAAGSHTYGFDVTSQTETATIYALARASHWSTCLGSGRITKIRAYGNGDQPALTGGAFI